MPLVDAVKFAETNMDADEHKNHLLRKSRQREEILRILKGTTAHPTADWLYRRVRQSIPNVSLGTIYRNLRILQERGEIIELNCGDSLSRFDARTDEHYHFQCDKCGCIHDVEKCACVDICKTFSKQTGFTINAHRLELHGLCRKCTRGGSSSH